MAPSHGTQALPAALMSRPGPERRAQTRRPRPHHVHIQRPLTARTRRSISPSAAGWETGRATPGPRLRPTATWVRRNPQLRYAEPAPAPREVQPPPTRPRPHRWLRPARPRPARPAPSPVISGLLPPGYRPVTVRRRLEVSHSRSPTARAPVRRPASLGSALTSAGLGGVACGRGPAAAAAAALLPRLDGRS